MKQVELLSPAGSFESGVAAIQNGCDALYLAGTQFGARTFAKNFDHEQLKEIVSYAHAYGVKVYVTINTLIHDEEMEDVYTYVSFLYGIHVDAIIVQDIGGLYQIRTQFPNFEVHASTQMHIVNESALQFLISQGIKRAVLAREVSIEEIKQFAKLPIELEVFVHGAMCVSYSGECLFSFMVGGRSGNRGSCAQSCRMPYTLKLWNTNTTYDKAYHLSLKDLNTLEEVPALMEAGITSFKMEGRMKKSEYVAHMSTLYRQRIDNPHVEINELQNKVAKTLFHRGFTKGHLFNATGSSLYNLKRPNHIGIEVGKIVNRKKNQIHIRLCETLHQHDGIRFLNEQEDVGYRVNRIYQNGLLVNKANANEMIILECNAPQLKSGDIIVKTSDSIAEKEIQKMYDKQYRKVKLTCSLVVEENKVLRLKVSDGYQTIKNKGTQCIEVALKRATSHEEIKKQLQKTNDTIFIFDDIKTIMDQELFVPIKEINTLRRTVLEQMYTCRAQRMQRECIPFVKQEIKTIQSNFTIEAKVQNEQQLKMVLDCKVDVVYVEDTQLYEAYKEYEQVKLASHKVHKTKYDHVTLIQELGGVYACEKMVCDTSLNVYNAHSCYYLHTLGAYLIAVSLELSTEEVKQLLFQYQQQYHHMPALQKVIYGRCEVMISEHCPIHSYFLDKDKKNCKLCKHKQYALQDQFKNEYPLCGDTDCRMHIYDYQIHDEREKINDYKAMGITSVRYDFTFESAQEIKQILKR